MTATTNVTIDTARAATAHRDTIEDALDIGQMAVDLLVAGVIACHLHGLTASSIALAATHAADLLDRD